MATIQRIHHPSEETLLRCAEALEYLISDEEETVDTVADSILDRTITLYSSSALTKIEKYAFYGCVGLKTLILSNPTTVCELADLTAFEQSSFDPGASTSGITGKIYVPDDLVTNYRNAAVWNELAEYIFPISKLPIA